MACRIWGLRSTDIMQGVVFGTRIDQMGDDERLLTRFEGITDDLPFLEGDGFPVFGDFSHGNRWHYPAFFPLANRPRLI